MIVRPYANGAIKLLLRRRGMAATYSCKLVDDIGCFHLHLFSELAEGGKESFRFQKNDYRNRKFFFVRCYLEKKVLQFKCGIA